MIKKFKTIGIFYQERLQIREAQAAVVPEAGKGGVLHQTVFYEILCRRVKREGVKFTSFDFVRRRIVVVVYSEEFNFVFAGKYCAEAPMAEKNIPEQNYRSLCPFFAGRQNAVSQGFAAGQPDYPDVFGDRLDDFVMLRGDKDIIDAGVFEHFDGPADNSLS